LKNNMIKLNAKIRTEARKKVNKLRELGKIPAVVYGHKVKNVLLDVDYKEFLKVLKEAGESSLIELNILGYHGKCIKAEVEMGRGSIASVFCDFDRDKSMRGSIIDLQMGFRRDKMNDDNSVNIRLEPVLSGSYKEGFINVNTKYRNTLNGCSKS